MTQVCRHGIQKDANPPCHFCSSRDRIAELELERQLTGQVLNNGNAWSGELHALAEAILTGLKADVAFWKDQSQKWQKRAQQGDD